MMYKVKLTTVKLFDMIMLNCFLMYHILRWVEKAVPGSADLSPQWQHETDSVDLGNTTLTSLQGNFAHSTNGLWAHNWNLVMLEIWFLSIQFTNLHMSWQLSCHNIGKILNWSDHYFCQKINTNLCKIWIIISYIFCEMALRYQFTATHMMFILNKVSTLRVW